MTQSQLPASVASTIEFVLDASYCRVEIVRREAGEGIRYK